MPPSRWPFLDHPGPLPIAHRGGASDAPENTMSAFQAAVDLGYRYLETDVHVTADGVLLAFHDDHLDRVTDRTGAISQLPYTEVAKALVDGREPIPLLEDLLGEWPEARVNIDPKHAGAVDGLIDVIRRTDSVERVCIGAFSDTRLARIRAALGPNLCTSLGPREMARLRASSYGLPGGGEPPAPCVQVPTRFRGVPITDRRFVRKAHSLGLQIHVWTIDDPIEMHQLLNLGVDGIMTDRPATLRRVLVDRDEWVDP